MNKIIGFVYSDRMSQETISYTLKQDDVLSELVEKIDKDKFLLFNSYTYEDLGEKLQKDLNEFLPKLRVLNKWDICLLDDPKYKSQCVINMPTKSAVIYYPDEYTDDYIFHELLHVAYKAILFIPKEFVFDRVLEETLTQDLCSLVGFKDVEVFEVIL